MPTGLSRILILLAGLSVSGVAGADIAVVDDSDHTVRLAQPARRVVSLAPHLAEMMFALGADRQLVAVSASSDFPAAARSLPRISGAAGIDLEAIIAMRPDLVLGWQSGNPAQLFERLARLGIPVFLSEPRTLDQIATNFERLGQLTGHAKRAGAVAARFRRELSALRGRESSPGPRVFYQIWHQPLLTIGGKHFIADAIRLCGGTNVFEPNAQLVPVVNREAILALDPEVIVSADIDTDELFAQWRRWTMVSAVRNRRIRTVNADLLHRPGPRVVDGVAQLCAAIRQGGET
jgi:iron complex transport system substrate-binding protein